jgi:hypothetical protein
MTMLTSTDCDVLSSHTRSLAEQEPQRRTRLLTAAEGWLILGNELRDLEAKDRKMVTRRSRRVGAAASDYKTLQPSPPALRSGTITLL